MPGLGFESFHARLIFDLIREIESHAGGRAYTYYDSQYIVVTGWRFVAEVGFDDGENQPTRLPLEESPSQGTKEFTAGGLQQIKVASVINVIAYRTFTVSDTVLVAKKSSHGRSLRPGRLEQKFKGPVSVRYLGNF